MNNLVCIMGWSLTILVSLYIITLTLTDEED